MDRQGHQVLLGAVVEVALETASLGILGLDETLARRSDLPATDKQLCAAVIERGSEPGPPQYQTGLGGQSGEESLFDERECQPWALLQPEHPQELVSVAHGQGSCALGGFGQVLG
jgi:hypothetical protein